MVTRRTAPLAQTCLLIALVASLTSGCALVVDHGVDRYTEYHHGTTNLTRRFEVWGAGDVDFSADDRAVARIAPGGFLHVEERRSFRTRRVTVEPGPDGTVQVTHTVNGRAQTDDADSREELARLFLRVIRQTAVGAERRVGRILAQSGVDEVFDELAHVEGSRAVARYLTALLRAGNLDGADLERVADAARRRIASSGTRATFLIGALPSYVTEDAAQQAYFSAVSSISSSGSRARVLIGILEQHPDRRMLARLLRSTRSMSSSGAKARVLIAAVTQYENDPDVRNAFFEAANSVSSSGDHARALFELIDRDDLDQASMSSLLRSAGRISSGGTRARVLLAAADRVRNNTELLAAYEGVARGISSSADRRRVLAAVGLSDSEA
jgi:hypothetical protein